VEVTHFQTKERKASLPMSEAPKVNATTSTRSSSKPPPTPDKDRKKKKGLFGGLFGGGKKKKEGSMTPVRAISRQRIRKLKGVTSVEGSI
jgi:hypothetical protein